VDARLVSSDDTEVTIDHRMFVGFDPAHPLRAPLEAVTHEDEFLVGGQGGAVFCSAGNDFHPSVHVEVWTGRPPHPAPDEWEESAESTFDAPTGIFRIASLMGARAGRDITLGPPGRYRLRAHCRGRGEAMERLGIELFYHGIEEWLIQLWPDF